MDILKRLEFLMTNKDNTVEEEIDKKYEQYIHESNLIEGIDDSNEDKESLKAWKWLLTRNGINQTVLLELHRRITHLQLPENEAGHYRTIQVYVGNYTPTAPVYVPTSIGYWLQNWLDKTPKESHIDFEKIHPFIDGNGRTGRMLMWWQELKRGGEPTILLNSEKQDYYKWFNQSSNKEKGKSNE